jgi:hypothetical protein
VLTFDLFPALSLPTGRRRNRDYTSNHLDYLNIRGLNAHKEEFFSDESHITRVENTRVRYKGLELEIILGMPLNPTTKSNVSIQNFPFELMAHLMANPPQDAPAAAVLSGSI